MFAKRGAGPVGLAAADSAQLLGAGAVIVGDVNKARSEHAKSVGFEVIDFSLDASLPDKIAQLLKKPEVHCAIDAVGLEVKGHATGGHQTEAPVGVSKFCDAHQNQDRTPGLDQMHAMRLRPCNATPSSS